MARGPLPVPADAPDLRDRVRFESRDTTPDEYGNVQAGAFVARFVRPARIEPLRGGEGVIAARLEARQPALIIVRSDTQTRQITNDWRAIDDRSGRVYAVRTAQDMERRRQFVTLMCESGVAA